MDKPNSSFSDWKINPNIHAQPGRSEQPPLPPEIASDQPGAVWDTGQTWQPHRSVSMEKKDKSSATDLHILRLKPYMLCSPRKFRLTGSLGCIKPCLKKQKTWKLGNYLHLHWCCNSKRRQGEDTQQYSLLYVQISYVVVHTIRKTMLPNFLYVLSKSIKQGHYN